LQLVEALVCGLQLLGQRRDGDARDAVGAFQGAVEGNEARAQPLQRCAQRADARLKLALHRRRHLLDDGDARFRGHGGDVIAQRIHLCAHLLDLLFRQVGCLERQRQIALRYLRRGLDCVLERWIDDPHADCAGGAQQQADAGCNDHEYCHYLAQHGTIPFLIGRRVDPCVARSRRLSRPRQAKVRRL